MKKNLTTNKWNDIAAFPDEVSINFGDISGIVFTAKNISNSRLKGNMSQKHKLNKTNIISSYIENLNAETVSFNNSDIKDSRIISSIFNKCNFNHASQNNNLQSDNYYNECTFNQTSITLSDFKNCRFEKCDFSNIIISDCRFFNCHFEHCQTSNKMIESSLILDCSFKSTHIEVDTILGNFGLTKSNFTKCSIVVKGLKTKKYNLTQFDDALNELGKKTQNNIQKFRLAYFRKPSIISDFSTEVDNLFIVTDWITLGQNPNRFKLHIEKLHEFLLYEFDRDHLRLRTLIQLFEISSKLSDTFAVKSEFIDLQRTIDGVFLTLERILESHLLTAENLLLKCQEEGYCRILVEGPLDKDYYEEKLKPITDLAPLKFGKIIKHNSPNELFIHWEDIKDLWPLILFLFTTRFKIELNKLDQQTRRKRNKQNNILRDNQLIKIESTGLDSSDALSFRLKTLLPGHHELSLVMQFSLSRYKQLMKTVKGWISFESKAKESSSLNEI
jgi:uncharacterized protein YjbI with pentapeptide repeats